MQYDSGCLLTLYTIMQYTIIYKNKNKNKNNFISEINDVSRSNINFLS